MCGVSGYSWQRELFRKFEHSLQMWFAPFELAQLSDTELVFVLPVAVSKDQYHVDYSTQL